MGDKIKLLQLGHGNDVRRSETKNGERLTSKPALKRNTKKHDRLVMSMCNINCVHENSCDSCTM